MKSHGMFCGAPWDSMGLHGTSRDISWESMGHDVMGAHGAFPCDFMGCFGMSHEISWDVPWAPMTYHDLSWNLAWDVSLSPLGRPMKNPLGHPMKFHEVPWDFPWDVIGGFGRSHGTSGDTHGRPWDVFQHRGEFCYNATPHAE